MLGVLCGNYRIVDQIATGGMGTVYRAEHTLIGRIVAVKVLHPEMSANRDVVQRFFNEAKATTTIHHPGIVEVFDFGYLPSGNAYLVMELLEGETLTQRIRARGRMPEAEAALMMRGVCSALAAAHAKGIVHRDLKPDNIFVVADHDSALGVRPKLLDFGIAKLTDIGLAGTATKTGAVMGTPTYMSPEQCRGSGDVDHRADLYSIGCMLYELVAGRPPFINTGAGELIGSHLFVDPEPLSRHASVSPPFEALVMALLSKRPDQRVQTAVELAHLLVDVAQRAGWTAVTSTDPNVRASMPQMMPPRPSTSPSYTPTPAPYAAPTEIGAPMHTPMPTPAPMVTQTPTTLSGVASESMAAAQAPRKTLWIAIGGGLAAAVVGIVVLVATSGGDAPRAASQPDEPRGAIQMTTTPGEPTKPVETTKAVEPTKQVEPAKPATPVETAKPTKPVEPTTTTKPVEPAKPVEPTKRIEPTNPVDTTKPVETAKPTSTKPTKPTKPKPTKPKPTGVDLLETDL